VNEIEDSLLIRGNLKVEGSICATAIANTLVYETVQFQNGSNSWSIGIGSNGALDFLVSSPPSSNSQQVVSFTGSNMVLTGDVLFANSNLLQNQSNNFTSLSSLNNIVQNLPSFPGWLYNSNDMQIILGLSNGIPPWFLSQCNAIFQNGGCACGSNFVNEIDDSLLINGNLKVNGSICATSIMNALVYEKVDFQNGSNTWTIGIDSNGMLGFMDNNGAVFSLTQNQTLVFPTVKIASPSNDKIWWTQYVDASCNLIFQSGFGTMVEFSEMFHPELLNFTGKHRCLATDQETILRNIRDENKEKEYNEKGKEKGKDNIENDEEKNTKKTEKTNKKKTIDWTKHIGKIVVSTGKYANLDGDSKIAIDEALPVVALCRRRMDPCAFGIVGGVDTDGRFRMGNLAFVREQKTGPRLIVQSHGEGAIWISNISGPLKMGDLITSAPPPLFGYGMKQIHPIRTKMNYTVAKITCDCDFDEYNPENRHLIIKTKEIKGRRYKLAFVGCLYSL
jgi:predicted outer membrane lipoprotein